MRLPRLTRKTFAAGALLLSLLLILLGIYRDELRIIYNNGKILCLTCIGIK
ncbi:MAG: hypothetical protein ABGX17_05020 [Desulfurobacteriaceae bacterium]